MFGLKLSVFVLSIIALASYVQLDATESVKNVWQNALRRMGFSIFVRTPMDVAITIAKVQMESQKCTVVAQNVIMDAHINAINGGCVQELNQKLLNQSQNQNQLKKKNGQMGDH